MKQAQQADLTLLIAMLQKARVTRFTLTWAVVTATHVHVQEAPFVFKYDLYELCICCWFLLLRSCHPYKAVNLEGNYQKNRPVRAK